MPEATAIRADRCQGDGCERRLGHMGAHVSTPDVAAALDAAWGGGAPAANPTEEGSTDGR
jgi:hypothetical protein